MKILVNGRGWVGIEGDLGGSREIWVEVGSRVIMGHVGKCGSRRNVGPRPMWYGLCGIERERERVKKG